MFLVMSLMLLSAGLAAGGESVDLFVLAGQSNMQGWQGNAQDYPADP